MLTTALFEEDFCSKKELNFKILRFFDFIIKSSGDFKSLTLVTSSSHTSHVNTIQVLRFLLVVRSHRDHTFELSNFQISGKLKAHLTCFKKTVVFTY